MDNVLDFNNLLEKTIDNNLSKMQNSFLESTLGKAIDSAVNFGLKALLPDLIENQVISIKNSILENGIKEGINEAISNSIELGKSVVGVFTGNFENISQIQNVLKKGGLIDSVSSVIDSGIDIATKTGVIDKSLGRIITSGKKEILKNVSNSIDNSLSDQIASIEKIDKYCEKWQEAYNMRNFENMEKAYNKINKQIDKIVPLETTIVKAREIENLHNLIKNNGQNFDISTEAMELAKIL